MTSNTGIPYNRKTSDSLRFVDFVVDDDNDDDDDDDVDDDDVDDDAIVSIIVLSPS